MKFSAVTPKLVDGLSAIVGAEHMLLPAAVDDMLRYTHDVTEAAQRAGSGS